VSSVTYQKDDFCNPSFYPQGVLVVPVHSRGFMECDLAFDRVFCDDIEHIRGFKNFSHMHNPTEVATVLAGKASGRTSDHERILVYNIGLALHDVFFAAKILEMAKDSGVEIDLCSPTEKFYI
jgi:ornithine cyclodeaminase/alanine dehydrogenase